MRRRFGGRNRSREPLDLAAYSYTQVASIQADGTAYQGAAKAPSPARSGLECCGCGESSCSTERAGTRADRRHERAEARVTEHRAHATSEGFGDDPQRAYKELTSWLPTKHVL
ncbi:unnamed protein product [Chrysodeixis includens]|uniref:Uncharacterized protein n=1 Tax=Chrysodeixis includens TaxID=689277 RepID=A0A9N8KWI8_CHRIL|nr:unnamed protein product [Chrysodeixis includens]